MAIITCIYIQILTFDYQQMNQIKSSVSSGRSSQSSLHQLIKVYL